MLPPQSLSVPFTRVPASCARSKVVIQLGPGLFVSGGNGSRHHIRQ